MNIEHSLTFRTSIIIIFFIVSQRTASENQPFLYLFWLALALTHQIDSGTFFHGFKFRSIPIENNNNFQWSFVHTLKTYTTHMLVIKNSSKKSQEKFVLSTRFFRVENHAVNNWFHVISHSDSSVSSSFFLFCKYL